MSLFDDRSQDRSLLRQSETTDSIEKVGGMRYRSDSGKLWGLFSSSDRQRYDVLSCTAEGSGHVAIPIHPDERAWLCEKLAKADEGQPQPKRPETPVEGLSRLMRDVLASFGESDDGSVVLDETDPIIEEARELMERIDKETAMPWNGGL